MGQRARFPVDSVFLSARGRGEPRRTATATATSFVHEGPRRTAKNCNCNTFCPRRAAKDREGPRRTATATLFVHEGPRRTATATAILFVHEGQRRAAKNCNCNTFCPQRTQRATEGHGERQLQRQLLFFPRRAAKEREELQLQLPFVRGGHGGGAGNVLASFGLLEPHGWNAHTRSVRDGFGGGRCGGTAPAQGRAEGPTAQNCSG